MTALPHSPCADLWSPEQRARLVRLCASIVGDRADADDLAQETLLQAWRVRHRLTDATTPGGAQAWLDAVARNVCRRWLRARGSVPTPAADLAAGEARDLDSVLEREELVELLERALGLLPAATRDALVGHYVDELSHAEIAERLGTSPDAVSMRVSRGRRALRQLLETRYADDALAEGWVRRDELGWRPTRLTCVDCGSSAVQVRHTATEIAFRCQTCDPRAVAVRIPLDVPMFAELVGDLRRPSALQARISNWARDYWAAERQRCVRCERPVERRPYTRDEHRPWSSRHGWFARCACGQEVSGSVAGIALALPEVRAARRSDPRLRALPVRDVIHAGVPAKVVAYGSPQGQTVVSAVFLRDSLRLVHVD